jgi:hypothetical protein
VEGTTSSAGGLTDANIRTFGRHIFTAGHDIVMTRANDVHVSLRRNVAPA